MYRIIIIMYRIIISWLQSRLGKIFDGILAWTKNGYVNDAPHFHNLLLLPLLLLECFHPTMVDIFSHFNNANWPDLLFFSFCQEVDYYRHFPCTPFTSYWESNIILNRLQYKFYNPCAYHLFLWKEEEKRTFLLKPNSSGYGSIFNLMYSDSSCLISNKNSDREQ